MYTEASGQFPPGQPVIASMQTEPALRHNYNHVCINFWYHMFGGLGLMGSLAVKYTENGLSDTVWRKSGRLVRRLGAQTS